MGKDLATVVYYKKAAGVILQAVPLFTPCVGVCIYADDFCCNMFMHQEKPKFSSIAACIFYTSFYVMILFQWLAREFILLQNLIDRANEKGWRREYPFLIFVRLTNFLYCGNVSPSIFASKDSNNLVNALHHSCYTTKFVL